MNISRNKEVIRLDQTSYIERVLKKFNMFDCKSVNTPMETGLKLIKDDKKDSKYDYGNLVGCLMYIAVCSRPDIAHAVSVLSQFNECYTEVHWKAAKRLLRYLKGTSHYSLNFRKGCLDINGYADADWAGNTFVQVFQKSFLIFLISFHLFTKSVFMMSIWSGISTTSRPIKSD